MTKEEFREKRLELQLTQKELADILGITPIQISNIERGVSNITKRVEYHLKLIDKNQRGDS